MAKPSTWLVAFVTLSVYICGGRTECSSRSQVTLLTGIHVDPACKKMSPKGVLLYEAARYRAETHNNRTDDDGFQLELNVADTCGGAAGTLKAAMKAFVRTDVNCLQPPHYLGTIGPDGTAHIEVVQKVTSVLKVPQIVGEASRGPYLHHLSKDDGSHLVQGILRVLETLKWKSFVLADNAESGKDVLNVAKILTSKAIAKNLCVVLPDHRTDVTSHVVHVGKPAASFFNDLVNATILVVGERSLKSPLNRVTSTNTILLLEDTRNDLDELKERVERSRLWTGGNGGAAIKYDPEGLTEVKWIEDAIDIYAKLLATMCGKRKLCINRNASVVEWNDEITRIIAAREVASRSATRTLDLSAKDKAGDLKGIGRVIVRQNDAQIKWKGQDYDDHEDDQEDFLPETIQRIRSRRKESKESRVGCATSIEEDRHDDDTEEEVARVIVSEMDDREWWTTVATVSGVGVAMFVVGILAVYVIISNIRGPRSRKGTLSKSGSFNRDGTLRRVASERETSIAVGRDHRQDRRTVQRRDSNRSLGSNVSERSV